MASTLDSFRSGGDWLHRLVRSIDRHLVGAGSGLLPCTDRVALGVGAEVLGGVRTERSENCKTSDAAAISPATSAIAIAMDESRLAR